MHEKIPGPTPRMQYTLTSPKLGHCNLFTWSKYVLTMLTSSLSVLHSRDTIMLHVKIGFLRFNVKSLFQNK